MFHYNYLIVGGGMTASAAIEGIRQVDRHGSIGVISAEGDPPYRRPPLSKGLWHGDRLEEIWYDSVRDEAAVYLGRRATELHPRRQQVTDERGAVYRYDRLLLATGCTPRRLPFGDDHIIYFRTLADYRRLQRRLERATRVAIIGGGFIGSELAAALAVGGKTVHLIFPAAHIGARLFPADLARFVTQYYRDRGVEVRPGTSVVDIVGSDTQPCLVLQDESSGDEETVVVDTVVAGIGVEPNVALAEAAGLEVANGIVVDETLRTGNPNIFAAGDVAEFYNPLLGKRLRVEHEDNALSMGRAAGRAMAGKAEVYHHLPFFYSDLFDLGYEAVGEVDARLDHVADWKEPYREGVVYYLEAGRVRGVLLWNVWGQVDAARRLIAEPGPLRTEDLVERRQDVLRPVA